MPPIIAVEIKPPDDVLQAYSEHAERLPALTHAAFQRRALAVRRRVIAKLTVVPGPPHYPIRWKSRKQRRAYFATDGFGAGIPSERSGILLDSYDVRLETEGYGGFITVTNDDPKAVYVVGDEAQPFHLDTGYVQVSTVIAEERPLVEDELIDTYFTLTDPFAGVPAP